MPDYHFDPRIETAHTLPSGWYFDPAVLAREERQVFGRSWQLVGRDEQVALPGQYFTTTIAREPLLIVRGNDGVVRALSNVCRHRAGPIAAGEGKRPVLQCGYHGWTYTLDGTLHKTPEMEGLADFDRAAFCLPRFRIESWCGLLFVNLDPAATPLGEVLGDLSAHLETRALTRYRLAHRKVWELDCNWKVYVDNYLEGYHIPIVHPGLFREIDYPKYRTETRRWYSIQHAPAKNATRMRATDEEEAEYFWLFPNLMLNIYPDNFSTNLILPLGPNRTATLFDWYFEEPESLAAKSKIEETVRFSDEIQIEDIGICEAVQRGLASSTYTSGRYSPLRENGVHHFHGLLWEMAGNEPPRET